MRLFSLTERLQADGTRALCWLRRHAGSSVPQQPRHPSSAEGGAAARRDCSLSPPHLSRLLSSSRQRSSPAAVRSQPRPKPHAPPHPNVGGYKWKQIKEDNRTKVSPRVQLAGKTASLVAGGDSSTAAAALNHSRVGLPFTCAISLRYHKEVR